MAFHLTNDWSSRRSHMSGAAAPPGPMRCSAAHFCSDALQERAKRPRTPPRGDQLRPRASFLANFVSRIVNGVAEAVFHKRAPPPAPAPVTTPEPPLYYDCVACRAASEMDSGFDECGDHEPSPPLEAAHTPPHNECGPDMRAPPALDSLSPTRVLITSHFVPVKSVSVTEASTNPRPVHCGEEVFVDAFTTEDFDRDADIVNNYKEKTDKVNDSVNMDIVNLLPEGAPPHKTEEKHIVNIDNEASINVNKTLSSQLVSSCENKMNLLRAMLFKQKKSQNTNINTPRKLCRKPTPKVKVQNKKYKNPHRVQSDKSSRASTRNIIWEDMNFASELDMDKSSQEDLSTLTSSTEALDNGNSDCFFNEIRGRFRSNSATESEDSFQIVFADSPQRSPRSRRISDCDSEDSFIVFESEGGDGCYSTTDVFGEDSESGEESDSGCGTAGGGGALSRTVSDLTDDSLYGEGADQVDCAPRASTVAKSGQPPKKVRFSEAAPRVRVMRVWAFAARQARAGPWARLAADRERFGRRIADVELAVSWVLRPQHRARVCFQRFMPWWHAQRRRQLAGHAEHAPGHAPEHVPGHAPEHVPEHAPEHVPEHAPAHVSDELLKLAPEPTSEQAPAPV